MLCKVQTSGCGAVLTKVSVCSVLSISWLTEQFDHVTVDKRDLDMDERTVFHAVAEWHSYHGF